MHSKWVHDCRPLWKKIMPGANMCLVLCSFGITPASVVLALLVLSVGSPFTLSFMLASFVCLLHWCSLCWCSSCQCLSCVGAIRHAGVFVCAGACHALRWRSGVAFIVLVSVVGMGLSHRCGVHPISIRRVLHWTLCPEKRNMSID